MTGGDEVAGTRKSDSGFSLLEVMVGISILIGGLMGLGAAMITAYRLDRTSGERKVALSFCQGMVERLRGMTWAEVRARPRPNNPATADTVLPYGGFLPDLSWGTCASGYGNAVGTVPAAGTVGFRQDLDSDGDEDTFGCFYTRQTPPPSGSTYWSDVWITTSGGFYIKISDSRLNALTPRSGMNNRMAQVTFTEAGAANGLIEGGGYWVTVRVFWQGSSGGREEERVTTFISR